MSKRHDRLARARLYLVCDRRPEAFLSAALAGGVDVIQLRDKAATDDELRAAAEIFRRVAAEHGALFVINDRPDLAVLVDADGAHVGQDDVSVAEARAAVGADRVVGLSTHSEAQIEAAGTAPDPMARPDYIAVGPVHATPTKPGRPPVGLALIRLAADRAPVPWFAIGGIAPDTIAPIVDAGASRVVVVRAVTEAADPKAIARTLRHALPKETSVGTP